MVCSSSSDIMEVWGTVCNGTGLAGHFSDQKSLSVYPYISVYVLLPPDVAGIS